MIRFINAPLSLDFDLYSPRYDAFEREYVLLSQSVEDPALEWVKLAKARGETDDTDTVLLDLMIELYKKLERIEAKLDGKTPHYEPLTISCHIDEIGFEHLHIVTPLAVGEIYYARADLPVFPKRIVPLFFRALEPHIAVIERMHDRDKADWDAYIVRREREIIKESRL